MRLWCLDLLQPSCGHEVETSHHFIIIIIGLFLPGERYTHHVFVLDEDRTEEGGWMHIAFVFAHSAFVEPYFFCSTILWILIPESLCSLGLTESHLLDSPLLVYSRMWLFLTISYVYSILYAFLCPQICKALSSLVPSVPFSLLSVFVGLVLFVLLYMGKYTG